MHRSSLALEFRTCLREMIDTKAHTRIVYELELEIPIDAVCDGVPKVEDVHRQIAIALSCLAELWCLAELSCGV